MHRNIGTSRACKGKVASTLEPYNSVSPESALTSSRDFQRMRTGGPGWPQPADSIAEFKLSKVELPGVMWMELMDLIGGVSESLVGVQCHVGVQSHSGVRDMGHCCSRVLQGRETGPHLRTTNSVSDNPRVHP